MASTPTKIPLEFSEQYERFRADSLRRHGRWYCLVVLALLALSLLMTGLDDAETHAARNAAAIEFYSDLAYLLLYLVLLGVLFLPRLTSRAIVAAVSTVVITTSAIIVFTTSALDNSDIIAGALPIGTNEANYYQGIVALLAFLLLHGLTSAFIAMPPRESIPIALTILLVFVLYTWLIAELTIVPAIALTIMAPLALIPGCLWSWRRSVHLTERFLSRTTGTRYADVQQDLVRARRIHEALFPPPLSAGHVRIHYQYEPAREIGGDFLFIHAPASDSPDADAPCTVVLIDVTGHGVAAALAVNRLHAELKRHYGEHPAARPAETLRALNALVFEALAPQTIFATALILQITPGSLAAVEWAGAGHPPAILRRSSAAAERLQSMAPMLGVVPDELFEPQPATTILHPGHAILAYTDGVIEACDERGRHLEITGAEQFILRMAPATQGAIAESLIRHVQSFASGEAPDDTLIIEITLSPDAAGSGPATHHPPPPST